MNASSFASLRHHRVNLATHILTTLLIPLAAMALSGCSPTASDATAGQPRGVAREAMTAERMGKLIQQVDPKATLTGSTWRLEAAGHVVAVVFDEAADRMRIMIPIGSAKELSDEEKTRLLQANFDSALDARYAIAQELVWGTYIHPLSPLTDEEFLLGLGQTVSVVETYGEAYSSGLFTFGAGDSAQIQRERLLKFLQQQET